MRSRDKQLHYFAVGAVIVRRKLGSLAENVWVKRMVELPGVPRVGDTVKVADRKMEVMEVVLEHESCFPEVTLKPDYRAYKGRDYQLVLQDAITEGWHVED